MKRRILLAILLVLIMTTAAMAEKPKTYYFYADNKEMGGNSYIRMMCLGDEEMGIVVSLGNATTQMFFSGHPMTCRELKEIHERHLKLLRGN